MAKILAIGLVSIGAVVALFVVPGVVTDRSGNGPSDDGGNGDTSSFAVPDGEPTPVDPARIMVTASSHLPPANQIDYDPANTIDGDPGTAWNSDAQGTEGRGETLVFRFAEPVDLKVLRFVNGYAKSSGIFDANHRLRDVVVRTDQGARSLTLLDTSDPQEVGFDFGLTSKVIVEVVDVYTGTGFADSELTADLAVSEIGFVAIQR